MNIRIVALLPLLSLFAQPGYCRETTSSQGVSEVVVVFKTHFDIGFTAGDIFPGADENSPSRAHYLDVGAATCPVMKRNGTRGLESNLIKTRQAAKVDSSCTERAR